MAACARNVRLCRYRFKFQSNLVCDLIKPISNFCFQLIPLYPNSPVGENR
jgi:hypothetical protein